MIQGPNLKDLSNFVVPKVGSKWYMLGVQLLDQQYVATLQTIKADCKKAEERCIEMFNEWLTTDNDASWDKLIDGLKSPSVKLNSLAEKLQKMPKNVCIKLFVYLTTILLMTHYS